MKSSSLRAKLKNKLRSREKVFGGWTSLAHPSITEIFTRIGVDFVGIDIEHSTINQGESQRIIAAAQASHVLCLPRIATHNMEMIKRLLDSGADGIIAPMVSSTKEVNGLVSWITYPPKGIRSYGISRAQGYGMDFDEYVKKWNEESIFIIQIESVEGVQNAEELIKMSEVDGVMIGPYDLSGTVGIPGQLDHPNVKSAVATVSALCKKYGKSLGTQITDPNMENVQNAFNENYQFIVLASDIFLLWKWSEQMKNIVDLIRRA